MNLSEFPVLETNRCVLRLLQPEDVDEIFELRSNRSLVTYVNRPVAVTKQDAIDFISMIREGIEKDQWINWAITLKGEDRLIGTLGYWHYHESLPQAEIGYELLPEHHGQGIMSEAMGQVIPYAWASMGLKAITAFVHEKNQKSINVLKRFGFTYETTGKDKDEPKLEYWVRRIE